MSPHDMHAYMLEVREELMAASYTYKLMATNDGEKPCNPGSEERPKFLSLRGAIARVGNSLAERVEVLDFLAHHGLHFGHSDPFTKQKALDITERALRVLSRIVQAEQAQQRVENVAA